jgi:hypothetical protein
MARRNERRRSAVSQWRQVVVTAAGVLAAAAATAAVVHTGDSATTTADHPSANRTVTATRAPHRERPADRGHRHAPGADIETPVSLPPTTVAAVPQARTTVDPRLVVYTVAGNQRPNDPVTVIYADEDGALHTRERHPAVVDDRGADGAGQLRNREQRGQSAELLDHRRHRGDGGRTGRQRHHRDV